MGLYFFTFLHPQSSYYYNAKIDVSIFSLQEELCPRTTGVSSHECVWASAVSVRDKYMYVTQPLHNRLLLIDTQAQRVVQVRTRVSSVFHEFDKV